MPLRMLVQYQEEQDVDDEGVSVVSTVSRQEISAEVNSNTPTTSLDGGWSVVAHFSRIFWQLTVLTTDTPSSSTICSSWTSGIPLEMCW